METNEEPTSKTTTTSTSMNTADPRNNEGHDQQAASNDLSGKQATLTDNNEDDLHATLIKRLAALRGNNDQPTTLDTRIPESIIGLDALDPEEIDRRLLDTTTEILPEDKSASVTPVPIETVASKLDEFRESISKGTSGLEQGKHRNWPTKIENALRFTKLASSKLLTESIIKIYATLKIVNTNGNEKKLSTPEDYSNHVRGYLGKFLSSCDDEELREYQKGLRAALEQELVKIKSIPVAKTTLSAAAATDQPLRTPITKRAAANPRVKPATVNFKTEAEDWASRVFTDGAEGTIEGFKKTLIKDSTKRKNVNAIRSEDDRGEEIKDGWVHRICTELGISVPDGFDVTTPDTNQSRHWFYTEVLLDHVEKILSDVHLKIDADAAETFIAQHGGAQTIQDQLKYTVQGDGLKQLKACIASLDEVRNLEDTREYRSRLYDLLREAGFHEKGYDLSHEFRHHDQLIALESALVPMIEEQLGLLASSQRIRKSVSFSEIDTEIPGVLRGIRQKTKDVLGPDVPVGDLQAWQDKVDAALVVLQTYTPNPKHPENMITSVCNALGINDLGVTEEARKKNIRLKKNDVDRLNIHIRELTKTLVEMRKRTRAQLAVTTTSKPLEEERKISFSKILESLRNFSTNISDENLDQLKGAIAGYNTKFYREIFKEISDCTDINGLSKDSIGAIFEKYTKSAKEISLKKEIERAQPSDNDQNTKRKLSQAEVEVFQKILDFSRKNPTIQFGANVVDKIAYMCNKQEAKTTDQEVALIENFFLESLRNKLYGATAKDNGGIAIDPAAFTQEQEQIMRDLSSSLTNLQLSKQQQEAAKRGDIKEPLIFTPRTAAVHAAKLAAPHTDSIRSVVAVDDNQWNQMKAAAQSKLQVLFITKNRDPQGEIVDFFRKPDPAHESIEQAQEEDQQQKQAVMCLERDPDDQRVQVKSVCKHPFSLATLK